MTSRVYKRRDVGTQGTKYRMKRNPSNRSSLVTEKRTTTNFKYGGMSKRILESK